jgi:hypothetical protein
MTKKPDFSFGLKYSEVTFLPGGETGKHGCIVEKGSPVEYGRPEHLRLILNCTGLVYKRSWSLGIGDPADQSTWTDEVAERYSGAGEIEPSQHGEYSFSFFGSGRTHRRLRVVIRRAERKTIFFVPTKCEDGGSIDDEGFAVEINLDARSFDELKEELRANPDFRTDIAVRLDGLNGIYSASTERGPEACVIKVLNSRDDVSNRESMPDDFGAVILGEPFPFSVTVGPAEN